MHTWDHHSYFFHSLRLVHSLEKPTAEQWNHIVCMIHEFWGESLFLALCFAFIANSIRHQYLVGVQPWPYRHWSHNFILKKRGGGGARNAAWSIIIAEMVMGKSMRLTWSVKCKRATNPRIEDAPNSMLKTAIYKVLVIISLSLYKGSALSHGQVMFIQLEG